MESVEWGTALPWGTPKAWRGNKDPPMRLHGKDLDIAAIASTPARTRPGKERSKMRKYEKRLGSSKDDTKSLIENGHA